MSAKASPVPGRTSNSSGSNSNVPITPSPRSAVAAPQASSSAASQTVPASTSPPRPPLNLSRKVTLLSHQLQLLQRSVAWWKNRVSVLDDRVRRATKESRRRMRRERELLAIIRRLRAERLPDRHEMEYEDEAARRQIEREHRESLVGNGNENENENENENDSNHSSAEMNMAGAETDIPRQRDQGKGKEKARDEEEPRKANFASFPRSRRVGSLRGSPGNSDRDRQRRARRMLGGFDVGGDLSTVLEVTETQGTGQDSRPTHNSIQAWTDDIGTGYDSRTSNTLEIGGFGELQFGSRKQVSREVYETASSSEDADGITNTSDYAQDLSKISSYTQTQTQMHSHSHQSQPRNNDPLSSFRTRRSRQFPSRPVSAPPHTEFQYEWQQDQNPLFDTPRNLTLVSLINSPLFANLSSSTSPVINQLLQRLQGGENCSCEAAKLLREVIAVYQNPFGPTPDSDLGHDGIKSDESEIEKNAIDKDWEDVEDDFDREKAMEGLGEVENTKTQRQRQLRPPYNLNPVNVRLGTQTRPFGPIPTSTLPSQPEALDWHNSSSTPRKENAKKKSLSSSSSYWFPFPYPNAADFAALGPPTPEEPISPEVTITTTRSATSPMVKKRQRSRGIKPPPRYRIPDFLVRKRPGGRGEDRKWGGSGKRNSREESLTPLSRQPSFSVLEFGMNCLGNLPGSSGTSEDGDVQSGSRYREQEQQKVEGGKGKEEDIATRVEKRRREGLRKRIEEARREYERLARENRKLEALFGSNGAAANG